MGKYQRHATFEYQESERHNMQPSERLGQSFIIPC